MTQLERADLHAAIEVRYPDNTTEDITPKDLRDGLHELVDSVFVTATDTGAVPNVPEYKPGTFYVVGYTVRYTPVGGSEGFYAAKTAGKHTAPGPGNYIDWKVVPGPVTPTALSQELTLSQAQGLDQAGVVAGREYVIDCGPNGNGKQQYVTVRGIANDFFDVEGTLEVNGVRTAITNFQVQAGTWTVKQYGASGASNFNQLGGLPTDNAALATALAGKADLDANGKILVSQLVIVPQLCFVFPPGQSSTRQIPITALYEQGQYRKLVIANMSNIGIQLNGTPYNAITQSAVLGDTFTVSGTVPGGAAYGYVILEKIL